MAKGKLTKEQKRKDELRWQAENIVKQAISKTPAFKQAVKETIKSIEATERDARKLIGGKSK